MRPVLVVEEAAADIADVLLHVRRSGYECLTVTPAGMDVDVPVCSLILIGAVGAEVSGERLRSWRQRCANLPCVVLTGASPSSSSESALRADVSGMLPWTDVESDLIPTLQAILGAPATVSPDAVVSNREVLSYTIENNPELLPLIVSSVRQRIVSWPFQDSIELERVTVALSEALDNALYHGNLDLNSDLRQGSGQAWREESHARRTALPYRDRRIRFRAIFDCQGAEFIIRDEGIGFDPAVLSDCTQMQNLERCSGRGLFLMKMYMDEMRFNATGNEITLQKHRPAELSGVH
ncbi:MAG: response regulator receiver [Schlesneria sp.]|nr:response regulator receiver [Schlesneria sp.]